MQNKNAKIQNPQKTCSALSQKGRKKQMKKTTSLPPYLIWVFVLFWAMIPLSFSYSSVEKRIASSESKTEQKRREDFLGKLPVNHPQITLKYKVKKKREALEEPTQHPQEISFEVYKEEQIIVIKGFSDLTYSFLGILSGRTRIATTSIIDPETLSTVRYFRKKITFEKEGGEWQQTEIDTRYASFHPLAQEIERPDRHNKIYSLSDFPFEQESLTSQDIIVDPLSIFYFLINTEDLEALDGKQVMYSRGKEIMPYRFQVKRKGDYFVVKIISPESIKIPVLGVEIKVTPVCWVNQNQEIEKIEMVASGIFPNIEMTLQEKSITEPSTESQNPPSK